MAALEGREDELRRPPGVEKAVRVRSGGSGPPQCHVYHGQKVWLAVGTLRAHRGQQGARADHGSTPAAQPVTWVRMIASS